MSKPRSRAGINMLAEHQIPRHFQRLRTLSAAIEKTERRLEQVRAGTETHWSEAQLLARLEQLRAEVTERREKLAAQRATIDAALA